MRHIQVTGWPSRQLRLSFFAPFAAMPWFWKPYKSDISSFIDELKAKKPSLEDEQRRGRAIWWDRRVDLQAETEYEDARVRQQPYVYQTKQR